MDKEHGRIEERTIQVMPVGKRRLFPFAKQAMRITRTRTTRDGKTSTEIAYCITSLSPQRASPEKLLEINRGHWHVENKVHYVRDVSQNEDRRYRRTNPGVFATLHNLTLSLGRMCSTEFLPSIQRALQMQPAWALRMVGIV